jgi:head-tail adaptor
VSVGATGLLDRRCRLFAYTVDVDEAGLPLERYPEWGTRWCRLEPPTGREVTAGQREAHRIDAVLVFRADIPVDAKWLARVGGHVYRVLAVLPRRMQGLVHVMAQSADDAPDTLVES